MLTTGCIRALAVRSWVGGSIFLFAAHARLLRLGEPAGMQSVAEGRVFCQVQREGRGGRAGRQPCLLDVGVRALLVLGDGPRPRDAQTAWTAGRASQAHSWT